MIHLLDRSNSKGLSVLLISILFALILSLFPQLGGAFLVNLGVVELSRAFHQSGIEFTATDGSLPAALSENLLPDTLAKSRNWLEAARAWNRKNARVYYALGRLSIAERNPAAAKSMLITGSQLAPPDRSAYFLLGNLYASQRNLDEAINAWRTARAAAIFLRKAESLWRQIPEAEAQYRLAIAVEPDNYKIFQSLGYFYWNSARPQEAMATLEKAHELAPDNPYTKHLLRGEVLHLQGKYLEASEEFLQAIKLNSSDPQPFYRAGDAFAALGQPGKALDMYKKALSRTPNEGWLLTRIRSVEGATK